MSHVGSDSCTMTTRPNCVIICTTSSRNSGLWASFLGVHPWDFASYVPCFCLATLNNQLNKLQYGFKLEVFNFMMYLYYVDT